MHSQPSGDTETFRDQSHLSGDTKILRNQSHLSWDMEVTQEQPKHPEGLGEQEVVTQETTSLQLPIESTTENQEVTVETQEDAEIGTREDVAT